MMKKGPWAPLVQCFHRPLLLTFPVFYDEKCLKISRPLQCTVVFSPGSTAPQCECIVWLFPTPGKSRVISSRCTWWASLGISYCFHQGLATRHPLVSYGGSAYGLAHFLSNLFRENLAMKCEIGGFPEKYFHLFLEHLRPPIIEAVGDSQAFREGLYFKWSRNTYRLSP